MKHSFLHRITRRVGFTIVELLVAMAVLSIMLIGLATSMDYVSRLWLNGIGSMDNFTKARVVMNLLDRDIQMMVLRRDVAAFVDGTGKPACAFYSNVQGNPGSGLSAPDTRAVSLVQYLVVNPSTTPTLERLNYGMNFLTSSGATPTVGNTNNLPIPPAATPANWALQTETVFTGIIALQIQFVDGNGNILTPLSGGTGTMLAGAPFIYDFPTPGDPANPRAVIVSMVVLSNPAYNVAINSGTLATVANMFLPDTLPVSSTSPTYSQAWNAYLNSPPPAFLALPAQVRSGIQVFERHIPLPITTPSAS